MTVEARKDELVFERYFSNFVQLMVATREGIDGPDINVFLVHVSLTILIMNTIYSKTNTDVRWLLSTRPISVLRITDIQEVIAFLPTVLSSIRRALGSIPRMLRSVLKMLRLVCLCGTDSFDEIGHLCIQVFTLV